MLTELATITGMLGASESIAYTCELSAHEREGLSEQRSFNPIYGQARRQMHTTQGGKHWTITVHPIHLRSAARILIQSHCEDIMQPMNSHSKTGFFLF